MLVEDPDGWAYADDLRDAGFDVVVCTGPGPSDTACGSCPLVEDGRCEAVETAEVVLSSLAGDVGPSVVEAIAGVRPTVPIVLAVPSQHVERYRAIVPQASVIPFPTSVTSVRDALHSAVAQRSDAVDVAG